MGNKDDKTNVMRILDSKKVPYAHYAYSFDGVPSGTEAAEKMGKDPSSVFKTLVTVGKSGEHYVFVIPVDRELDLKKAAAAVGEKNIEMIRSKELLPLTGYVHGGCSPVGMKKFFTTTFDASAGRLTTVTFSAGRIGRQVELALSDLEKVIRFSLHDLCADR